MYLPKRTDLEITHTKVNGVTRIEVDYKELPDEPKQFLCMVITSEEKHALRVTAVVAAIILAWFTVYTIVYGWNAWM
jgi:uncharacterized protein YxeA